MRALNSRFVLLNLHSSWNSANPIPISACAYHQSSNLVSPFSSSFRRTNRARKGIASSGSSTSSIPSPEIRRPGDRFSDRNGVMSKTSISTSTSRSGAASELELFLELVPSRMRKELFWHAEIESPVLGGSFEIHHLIEDLIKSKGKN